VSTSARRGARPPGTLRAVTFRPDAIRGAGSAGAGATIDYRLARLAVVSEYRKGRLARHEVCDAHPELHRQRIATAALRQKALVIPGALRAEGSAHARGRQPTARPHTLEWVSVCECYEIPTGFGKPVGTSTVCAR